MPKGFCLKKGRILRIDRSISDGSIHMRYSTPNVDQMEWTWTWWQFIDEMDTPATNHQKHLKKRKDIKDFIRLGAPVLPPQSAPGRPADTVGATGSTTDSSGGDDFWTCLDSLVWWFVAFWYHEIYLFHGEPQIDWEVHVASTMQIWNGVRQKLKL